MASIKQFLETIEVAREPIKKMGYKMDSTTKNNMRHLSGLGTCHCCDYFIKNKNSVVLIEETQLMQTIKGYKQEYDYLNKQDLDKIQKARIREENILKVYGSLLVLCKLAIKHEDFRKLMEKQKYSFWLVISDAQLTDMISLQELQGKLTKALRSVLGKEMIDEIKVFPSDMLEDKILQYAPTP